MDISRRCASAISRGESPDLISVLNNACMILLPKYAVSFSCAHMEAAPFAPGI